MQVLTHLGTQVPKATWSGQAFLLAQSSNVVDEDRMRQVFLKQFPTFDLNRTDTVYFRKHMDRFMKDHVLLHKYGVEVRT